MPTSVRATAADDKVVLSVGEIVPVEEFAEGQEEHEWTEESSITLAPDEASELADALPGAVGAARTFIATQADAAAAQQVEAQSTSVNDDDDEPEPEPKSRTTKAKAKS